MSNQFPTAKNNFVTGASSGLLGTVGHAASHNALETKIGIDNSADATSIDYLLKSTSSSNPGHKHTLANGATDVTATNTELNYVSGVTSAIQTQLNTKVATTRTVNGHALSSDVTVTASDLSLGNVDNTSDATKNSATATLTNKRIDQRVVSATSYTTDTGTSLSVATADMFIVTAQAGALKFNNPGGTPVQGQKLIIRIKDDGTARALTYDTYFRAIGTTLPSTTVLSKTLYMGFIFNSTDTKWDLLAVGQEA